MAEMKINGVPGHTSPLFTKHKTKTIRDKKRLKDIVKDGEDEAALQKKIDEFVMTYFLRAL